MSGGWSTKNWTATRFFARVPRELAVAVQANAEYSWTHYDRETALRLLQERYGLSLFTAKSIHHEAGKQLNMCSCEQECLPKMLADLPPLR